MNNKQFLYSALSLNELKVLYVSLSSAHLYTPTPAQLLSRDTYYTSTMGDQCTITFSVYCQCFIYGWSNQRKYKYATNLAQGLMVPKTKDNAGLKFMILKMKQNVLKCDNIKSLEMCNASLMQSTVKRRTLQKTSTYQYIGYFSLYIVKFQF